MSIPITYVGYRTTMGGWIPGIGVNPTTPSIPKSTIAASDTYLNGGVQSAASAASGGTMSALPWIAGIGALVGGVATGVGTYYSRKEGREQDRQHNKYMMHSANLSRQSGINAQYIGNQLASGQLSYAMRKARRDPQALEALSQMYYSTVAQGTQARMQGIQQAAQYMANRKALTNSKYDWIAAITSGIAGGLGTGGQLWGTFTQPTKVG